MKQPMLDMPWFVGSHGWTVNRWKVYAESGSLITWTCSKMFADKPLQIFATPGLFAKEHGEMRGMIIDTKDLDENGSLDDFIEMGAALPGFPDE